LLGIAAVFAALVPLLALVVDHPGQVGQLPWGASGAPRETATTGAEPPLPSRLILSDTRFWIVSLGVGAIAGTGSAYVVHIMAFGVEQKMTLQGAALLLSVYSGSGILGTLLFGWLADRAGPVAALAATAFFQAILWWAVVHASGTPLLAVSALMGVCVVPINTLHGAAISALYSGSTVARAMGCSYLVKLPFLFTFAPLVGLLFEHSGQYRLPFLAMSGVLAGASAMFVLLLMLAQRSSRAVRAAT
jgi:MFS family permease